MIFGFLCRCFGCFCRDEVPVDQPKSNPRVGPDLIQALRDKGLIRDSDSSDDGSVAGQNNTVAREVFSSSSLSSFGSGPSAASLASVDLNEE